MTQTLAYRNVDPCNVDPLLNATNPMGIGMPVTSVAVMFKRSFSSDAKTALIPQNSASRPKTVTN